MTKKQTRKSPPKNTGHSTPPWFFRAMEHMALIQGRVGLVGFIVIILTIILFTFPSADQKQEIVDMWVLFKNEGHLVCVLLGIAGLFLLAAQQLHYMKVSNMNEVRLKEMANEKKALQEKLLGNKELGTSDYQH